MKRENWMFLLGTGVAATLFCSLFLLLAVQPGVATPQPGQTMSLAEAPLIVKVLVGLAAALASGLLLAPLFQAQLKTLH